MREKSQYDTPVENTQAAIATLEEITAAYYQAAKDYSLALHDEIFERESLEKAKADVLAPQHGNAWATSRINGKNDLLRDGQLRALLPEQHGKYAAQKALVATARGRIDSLKIEYEAQIQIVRTHRMILDYLSAPAVE